MAKQQERKSSMPLQSKSTDFPEPWFSKKATSKSGMSKKMVTSLTVVEDDSPENVREPCKKRSRTRGKSEVLVVEASKRRKSRKQKSQSTLETSLSIPKAAVANVEELRRKREQDAAACGRTVKTVFSSTQRRSVSPAASKDSSEGDRDDEVGTMLPATVFPCRVEESATPTWTGACKELQDDARRLAEKEMDARRGSSSRRRGKEPIQYEVEEAERHLQMKESVDQREPIKIVIDSDTDRVHILSRDRGRHSTQSGLPSRAYYSERYGRRARRGNESPRRTASSELESCSESMSMSPAKTRSSRSGTPDSRSPRQKSRNRLHRRRRGHRTSGEYKGDYYRGSPVRDRICREEDYGNDSRYFSRDRLHRRRNDSSSAKKGFRRGRSLSSERERVFKRGYTQSSSTSPSRRSRSETTRAGMERTHSKAEKDGGIAGTSSSLGRSERRRRQAWRESEKGERQKAGKKPFYLLVDGQGQPYGPGKPAWIAEINKLATHLDPSCTHVRKQTFEDVQTFRDRLHEKFEYSEALNEDHVRGLMGKAVTKRRAELITLIKNGKPQPTHVDHDIWLRLEKLAYSKQHEQKSAQGRHANGCRKTLGRTGAIGENGVREKLRSQLRRSPDPDEVEAEMSREKGFGGRKQKVLGVSVKEEKTALAMFLPNELMCSAVEVDEGQRLTIQAGDGQMLYEQRNGGQDEDAVEEGHAAAAWVGNAEDKFVALRTKKITTDEYIKELEARIQRLQAHRAEASTSASARP